MQFYIRIFILLLVSQKVLSQGLDLHSHLFLEHGTPGWFYKGSFREPLQANDWSSLRGTKTNEETLLDSKLNVVVASLHAVSLASLSMKDAIRAQIKEAEEFVARSPSWMIAKTSLEANQALKQKKSVLVLSLEGADGVLETEEDIREFVVDGPISIVTPLHLTDDQFGGAAFMWSYHGLVNFWPYLKSLFGSSIKIEDVHVNELGLTKRGEWLISQLLKTRAWIDLTHASDKAQTSMISMLAKQNQPLLYTHTSLREFHGAERGLAKWQIDQIKQKGGMVGLLPSRTYLNGTPDYECDFKAFYNQYKKLANQVGRDSVTVGSDLNAPIEHLGPGCRIDDALDNEGFWKQNQVSDLWRVVNKFQSGIVDPKGQVNQFLKLWGRVR